MLHYLIATALSSLNGSRNRSIDPKVARLPTVLPFFAAILAAVELNAEDVVIYSSQQGTRTSRYVGIIEDYTGETLTIRLDSGRVRTVPSESVREVQSEWTESHFLGDERYEVGDYTAALTAYQNAFRVETRPWVKRRIADRITWCLRYQGQTARAVRAFLWIYNSDPKTQALSSLPLAWTAQTVTPSLQQQLSEWLQDESNVARLVAASWLIGTNQRAEAIRALQTIDDSDRRITLLAAAQLWRTKVVTATTDDLSRWETQIAQLPESLRAGPYFVEGQASAKLKRHEQAALSFLRIPIHFPQHRSLAARALVSAARELQKLGLLESARPLYQEVISQYAESSDATVAQQELQRLNAAGP